MIMKSIHDKKSSIPQPQTDEHILDLELQELETQLVHIKSNQTEQVQQRQKQDIMDIDQSWKLYNNWKPCPMGTLPNGKVPCLDMHL